MRNSLKIALLSSARRSSGGGGGPGSDIVSTATILNDIGITIASPLAATITMQTNGCALKLNLSGSFAYTSFNPAAPPVALCRARGHNATGAQDWDYYAVTFGTLLLGPYNEKTPYQPNPNELYLVGDDYIYNQDGTWKTEVLSILFPAGWITGRPEAQVMMADIIRSDSLAFLPFPMRDVSVPFGDAIPNGGTFHFECEAANTFAKNFSQVACVEAWLVDKDGTAGPVSVIGTMGLSSYTPGGEPGLSVPSYKADLATTGLAQGRCHTRHIVKPWRGPPQDSETYGMGLGDYLSPVKGVPVWLDVDGSHARLYGILAQNPATATIANDQSVPVDTTGLSLTIAGAIASGKTYANEMTLLMAVQTVNNSGVNVNIAHPSTGAALAYKRTTPHNDWSGASIVCRAVGGSVAGADTGAYCMRNQPPGTLGEVSVEIRSESGLVSDDVRWRGVDPYTGSSINTWNLRTVPSRLTLRGIYADAVGATSDVNAPVFSAYGATDATIYTEDTVGILNMIDCKVRGRVAGASPFGPVILPSARALHIRVDWQEDKVVCFFGYKYYSGGIYAAIGSKYVQVSQFSNEHIPCLLGCRTTNIGIEAQVLDPTSPRPAFRGRIYVNVDQETTSIYTGMRFNASAQGADPIRGGEGWINVLSRSLISGATNFLSFLMGADSAIAEMNGLIMFGCGAWFPNQTLASGGGRYNGGYNDVGYVSVNKRILLKYCYFNGYNIKGDSFLSATNASGAPTHSTATAYTAGAIVKNAAGTLGYQAKRDVPIASIAITDTTYWGGGIAVATNYGARSERQGNMAQRYLVGSRGVIASSSADSSGAPSAISWYGYAFPASAGHKYQSDRTLWMSSGVVPSATGDLAHAIPSGMAYAPFDLYGSPINNTGNGYAGPVQA